MGTEILAPVGGKEQLIAAVRCGANAVYLGTKAFNARGNAENIDALELKETVDWCHARNVAVHVTVNTLLTDSELPEMERLSDQIAAAGADGVIIQDMATFNLFKNRHPEILRVASTQAVVHNVAGAKLMQELGYGRIVVARELSFKEIEAIREAVDIEIEVFVHGAMCMCVSGMCYLSSMIGGRSGNRGLCAQPCRLDFKSGDRPYALSLKDMSYLQELRELARIGVDSFKIEGRMKRPEYVAAAVTACRQALDTGSYDDQSLRAVFSRSGFSDGYLRGKRDLDMFGYRRKEDVTAATTTVLNELAALYKDEPQILDVDMELTLQADAPAVLRASCDGLSVTVEGAAPQPARTSPTDREKALRNLQKMGGTPYRLRSFTFSSGEGLMMPASELNALRRNALDALTAARTARPVTAPTDYSFAPVQRYTAQKAPTLWGRFERAEQVPHAPELEKIILPLREIEKNPALLELYGDRLVGEFPAVAFPEYEEKVRAQAAALHAAGLREVYAENLYAVAMAKELGYTVHGGAALNILNTEALRAYAALGLASAAVSFELSMGRIADLGGTLPRGLVAYGRLPLMRVRNCPGKGKKGCGSCNGASSRLIDRKKAEFPLLCDERRYTTVLNSVPLHIADRRIANVDYLVLYFTLESRDRCAAVIGDYLTGAASAEPRTGGLYYRTIQ